MSNDNHPHARRWLILPLPGVAKLIVVPDDKPMYRDLPDPAGAAHPAVA
jgi:hypothetical protein